MVGPSVRRGAERKAERKEAIMPRRGRPLKREKGYKTPKYEPTQKVFDWHKAAKLIRQRKPKIASAGLSQDWEWTGGRIWENGKPVARHDTYTYLASTWATPELDMDGEIRDCFVMKHKSPGWGEGTYWPQSALDILKETR